jgi:hypothetical protein
MASTMRRRYVRPISLSPWVEPVLKSHARPRTWPSPTTIREHRCRDSPGSRHFDKIRKTLVYLLAGNTPQLTVMLVGAIGGLALRLIALQLLWINIRLLGMVVVSMIVQITIHHVAETQAVFEIELMPPADFILGLAVALVPVTVIERWNSYGGASRDGIIIASLC